MSELNCIAEKIEKRLEELTALRHELHAHPQVGFKETYASELVQRELTKYGVEFQADIATTGVVGWILPTDPAARARKAVALRADFDALAICEETALPYASQNPGYMHACGHDGHTAILLGAAAVLSEMRDALPRPVKLFFQPAEEGGGGAKVMIDEGCMGSAVGGVETGVTFALHNSPELPLGQLATRTGPIMASVNGFALTVTGHGGHGARPHETKDPVFASAQIINALQSIISRNVPATDPAVVSICSIHGGSSSNIIPHEVKLQGTIRTYNDATAEYIQRRVEEIAETTARGLNCETSMEYFYSYPVTVNAPLATAFAESTAAKVFGDHGVVESQMHTVSEDFSFFGQLVPSCMTFLGICPPGQEIPSLHNPKYDFNDQAIAPATEFFCRLALESGDLDID